MGFPDSHPQTTLQGMFQRRACCECQGTQALVTWKGVVYFPCPVLELSNTRIIRVQTLANNKARCSREHSIAFIHAHIAHTHACALTHTQTHAHNHTHNNTHRQTHVHTLKQMQASTCVQIQTYTHSDTHTRISSVVGSELFNFSVVYLNHQEKQAV